MLTTPLTDVDDGDDNNNPGTPVFFEIMSVNSPMLTGITGDDDEYNAGVNDDDAIEPLTLTPRDAASKDYDLLDWFSDPNDVFLDFDVKADQVAKAATLVVVPRPVVAKGGEAIVIATVPPNSNTLTIKLTGKALNADVTNVWVFAEDGNGEYARKQVQVTVGSATNPWVMTELDDLTLREGATANTVISDLTTGFIDPNGSTMVYAVSVPAAAGHKVDTATGHSIVASSMVIDVVQGETASVSIRPRAPGSITITVKATDEGMTCRAGFNYVDKDGMSVNEGEATQCLKNAVGYEVALAADKTGVHPDAESATDAFTVIIVSKTSPMVDEGVPAQTLVADGDTLTVDLADVDAETAGAQAAFADPTEEGLTYTVTAKDPIATVSVDSTGVLTLVPIWRDDNKFTDVTVTATNGLDPAESTSIIFTLTVTTAIKPVVNPLVMPALAMGFMLNTGDEALVLNLRNLTNADKAPFLPLFIDPNAATGDALPGGLLYKMRVEDVVAHLVYVNQSKENDVSTSAMRLVLDPAAATLTITPTAASSATVTISGTDRERNEITATTTITVVSCDGVDMSGSCDGVTVGTEGEELPTEVELAQNYPNPFNPQTTIDYALPKAGDVSLIVYDMLGREVDVLLDGPQAAGRHTVRFGANHLPNGTYVYRLVAADKTITRTMVLVK